MEEFGSTGEIGDCLPFVGAVLWLAGKPTRSAFPNVLVQKSDIPHEEVFLLLCSRLHCSAYQYIIGSSTTPEQSQLKDWYEVLMGESFSS
jgi:hypothetical protein